MSEPGIQAIIRRLEADDPLGAGADVRWRARRLQARRYSTIHVLRAVRGGERVRARLGTDEVVLKRYHALQAERRRQEFEDLVRVHATLGLDGGVVQPVACYEDQGAVLTARARGSPLARLIAAACRHGASAAALARAAALCTAAGAWLRRFQACGLAPMRGRAPVHLGDPGRFLDYIDERLRLLARGRAGIDGALRARLLAHAAAALHALPLRSFESVTWSHGDFGPHNVLVDGDVLRVLDLELAPQHPYFDASYFAESLANRHGPLVDAARVLRLERAFLAGYGAGTREPLFTLFRLRHALCTLVSESRRGGMAQLRAWPGRLALRGRLARFVTALPLRTASRAA